MSDNVINLFEKLKEIKNAETVDTYFPSAHDLQQFLQVLSFIRQLSVSHTGQLEFDEDSLRITLLQRLDTEALNEYGVTKTVSFHQETDMAFDFTTDARFEGTTTIEDATEDLLTALEGLLSWVEENGVQ